MYEWLWLIAILLSIFGFLIWLGEQHLKTSSASRKAQSSNKIYLVGTNGAGKTYLWQRLVTNQGRILPTISSISANVGVFEPRRHEGSSAGLNEEEKNSLFADIQIHDIPGHPELMVDMIDEIVKDSAGIILVIDSCCKNLSESAQLLFSIISTQDFNRRQTPLCVVFNKLAFTEAKHKSFVRNDLERAVEILRRAHFQSPQMLKLAGDRTILSWMKNKLGISSSLSDDRKMVSKDIFRLSSIPTKFFVLAQENDQQDLIKTIKSFVQRAALEQ